MGDADALAAYEQWHAEHPSTGQGPWYNMVADVLMSDGGLLADARVLEIGCGSGDFCAWRASREVNEVVGEDFASIAIRTAQSRHSARGLSFAVGDIENIAH